jgi:chorismate lyase/3-hydroxybenzoate synthase
MSPSFPFLSPAEHALLPPAWIGSLLGEPAPRNAGRFPAGEEVALATRGEHFCLVSVRSRGARRLDRAAFAEATARAYRRLEAELRDGPAPHPVRLWNHIPGIHDAMGGGQDRYMAFNAGRFAALATWLGGEESFEPRVAAASGIGHDGRDLVVHCLAADQPGRPVANPRQIAPYRYSRKYGPQPPCFARATVIQPPIDSPWSAPLVLVGGTASIVGEESVHPGDLARQTDETLTNLAAVLGGAAGEPAARRAAVLASVRALRVYYLEPAHRDALCGLVRGAFPHLEAIEWVRADLCRRELLVEIEGLAELD